MSSSDSNNDNDDTARYRRVKTLLSRLRAGELDAFAREAFPLHRIADALGTIHFWRPEMGAPANPDLVAPLRRLLRKYSKTRDINEKERYPDGSTWTPLAAYVRHALRASFGMKFDPKTFETFLDLGSSLRVMSGGTTVKRLVASAFDRDSWRPWFEARGIRFERGKKAYLTSWTTAMYRDVQAHRRAGTRPDVKTETERIDRYLAQHMRNSALRTPEMPPGTESPPRYLYRGVCDTASLFSKRYFREPGFISFSRDKMVADRFAKQLKMTEYSFFPIRKCPASRDYILRLSVRDLVPGIPWIWFSPKASRTASVIDESEVLFPPGYFKVLKRTGRLLDVEYVPDTNARSFAGKKIVRRLGRGERKRKRTAA